VAATRAIRRLHLLGHVNASHDPADAKPANDSLLAQLWPALGDAFTALLSTVVATPDGDAERELRPLQRLAADWTPTDLPSATAPVQHAPAEDDLEIEFEWAGNTARHVGSLVHRYLERIANEGLDRWPSDRIDRLKDSLRVGLSLLGVEHNELDAAIEKTQRALRNTLSDDTGRWILGAHQEAHCEWALTVHEEQARHYVIDRSFVDDDGIRWIVDYKTGDHQGGDRDRFLDEELERYRAQLENYGHILAQLDDRPIRLALYFPLLAAWRTWDHRSC
jgi:ATP-dependent helicase/nuclease subunit A